MAGHGDTPPPTTTEHRPEVAGSPPLPSPRPLAWPSDGDRARRRADVPCWCRSATGRAWSLAWIGTLGELQASGRSSPGRHLFTMQRKPEADIDGPALHFLRCTRCKHLNGKQSGMAAESARVSASSAPLAHWSGLSRLCPSNSACAVRQGRGRCVLPAVRSVRHELCVRGASRPQQVRSVRCELCVREGVTAAGVRVVPALVPLGRPAVQPGLFVAP